VDATVIRKAAKTDVDDESDDGCDGQNESSKYTVEAGADDLRLRRVVVVLVSALCVWWARRGEQRRRTTAGRRGTPRKWTRARTDEVPVRRQCYGWAGDAAAGRWDEKQRGRAWSGADGSEEAADASEERRGRAVQRSSCQARRVRTLTHQCQD
jgi:hypothetical protein